MNRNEFDQFCSHLTSATNVIQWGGASVWKIGGKIFALHPDLGGDKADMLSFKCSEMSYYVLCEVPGIVPAPYLARAKWVQITTAEAMPHDDICLYLKSAYDIISQKLTRAKRKELNI